MTPKDELLHEIGMPDSEETIKPIIDRYAIGRWVSVAERLPDFIDMGTLLKRWKGNVKDASQKCMYVTWFHDDDYSEITHWLELEMPGGAQCREVRNDPLPTTVH